MPRKPKEYEVERILKAVVSYKRSRTIHWKYYVKWKGYSDKRNSWEPVESFESSPQLIEKFWTKVDTGGRDITKASAFSLKEEIIPKDDTWTDEDADGEEDGEQAGEVGKENTSAETGTKRSAATPKGSPKRKRGRPSKADKEAENVAEEVQGTPESVEDDNPTTEQLPQNQICTARDAKSNSMTPPIAILSSDSEDDGMPEKSTKGKETSLKPPRKRRKVVIESGEEDNVDNSDAEASSHAGSLFSGHESDEEEETDLGKTAQSRSPGVSTSKSAEVDNVSPAPEHPMEIKKPKVPLNRLGKPIRRVQMIDDPEITKAIEKRVQGHLYNQPSASIDASRHVPSVGQIPYKPTLLTSEKGKLTSHRSKVSPLSPLEPTAPSTSVKQASPTTDEEAQELFSLLDAMDTGPDFPPSANIVGSLDSFEVAPARNLELGPPPTTENLFWSPGEGIAANGSSSSTTKDPIPVVPAASIADTAPSVFEPTSPGLHETGDESRKPSDISGPQTPLSILRRVVTSKGNGIQPSIPSPVKLVVPLRLGPTSVIPVVLKDTRRPTVGQGMNELLRPDKLEGPPGKLFPKNVFKLGAIAFPCASAKLDPDVGCSTEQRSWYTKLADELANGSLFFVEIGGRQFLLCSSENLDAGYKLMLPSQNLGIRRAVLIAFAPIWNRDLYESFVTNGREFPL